MNPTQDRVRQLFDYDEGTGVLTFRARPVSEFATPRAAATFAGKCEGKPAGWRHVAGYVAMRVDGKDMLAHRVAWLWCHGVLPDDEIDHINGDRSDNRLGNLRLATKVENSHNQSLRVTNKSGVNGVFKDSRRGGWRVEIVCLGRSRYLGAYKTIEEAAAARRGAEKALGFHRGHGKDRVGDYYKPRGAKTSPKRQNQPA